MSVATKRTWAVPHLIRMKSTFTRHGALPRRRGVTRLLHRGFARVWHESKESKRGDSCELNGEVVQNGCGIWLLCLPALLHLLSIDMRYDHTTICIFMRYNHSWACNLMVSEFPN